VLALPSAASRYASTGEHAAVSVVALGDVELHEHVADVGLDRPLAEEEPLADRGVRQATNPPPRCA
jgi:hypothetical protein